jgi:hypothetical protein
MSERIVSPGVFTRENDMSFLTQGIGQIGAAVIGPFHKGPAFVPTVLRTQADFEAIFGVPDGTFYTGKTVRDYLSETGIVTIVRVGHTGGYVQNKPFGVAVDGTLIGTFFASHLIGSDNAVSTPESPVVIDAQPSASEFSINIPLMDIEISASINPSKSNDISDVFGTSPKGSKKAYVYNYFEKTAEVYTKYLTENGGEVEVIDDLPNQEFNFDVRFASTPWIQSQLISGERYDLFRFHTIGDGTVYNREYKIAIYNVRPAGSVTSTNYAIFSVAVRRFSDTDKNQNVLEIYNNVTLDPASANYLPKVIGDRNLEIDANGKQTENGDYPNRSKYIRVEVKPEGSFPVTAAPFAHAAYLNPIYLGDTTGVEIPAVIFSTGSVVNTSTNTTKYAGIDLETPVVRVNNHNYLAPIPVGADYGSNTAFSFDGTITTLIDGNFETYNFGFEITGSNQTDINKRQFTVAFQEGFDGVSPTKHFLKAGEAAIVNGTRIDEWGEANSQGFDMSTSTAKGSVAYVKAINSISNADDFDINLVVTPGVVRKYHPYVFDKVVDMVEARADAFYIGEVVGITNVNGKAVMDGISEATEQASAIDSSYVGTYYPWVKVVDTTTNRLVSMPPSVLMPAVYAANDNVAAEWWAPAGLNRGGITGAISVLNKLTHSERDILYENKVNPIASFPGEGIVAFGQKTLQERSSALDRINVRRLLIKVKKFFASTSRYLIFEQNTAETRNVFLNTVTPYLEAIQQRQGLYSFRVVMDDTNNTPDVIDRNILVGQIYLQPTKTAEFIILDFNILPTGATFNV